MSKEDFAYEWFMQQLRLLLTPKDEEDEEGEEDDNGVFITEGS